MRTEMQHRGRTKLENRSHRHHAGARLWRMSRGIPRTVKPCRAGDEARGDPPTGAGDRWILPFSRGRTPGTNDLPSLTLACLAGAGAQGIERATPPDSP